MHSPYYSTGDIGEGLWSFAEDLSSLCDGMQVENNVLYEELRHAPKNCLGFTERARQEKNEYRYWAISQALADLRVLEEKVLNGAASLENGDMTAEEAMRLLPFETDIEARDEPPRLSKRRQAMHDQQERARKLQEGGNEFIDPWYSRGSTLGEYLTGEVTRLDGDRLTTDPRRLATGRNRTRLNASGAVDSMSAEAAFFEVTADTHGGKSRSPGKNGKYYVGKGGRRIRKK